MFTGACLTICIYTTYGSSKNMCSLVYNKMVLTSHLLAPPSLTDEFEISSTGPRDIRLLTDDLL